MGITLQTSSPAHHDTVVASLTQRGFDKSHNLQARSARRLVIEAVSAGYLPALRSRLSSSGAPALREQRRIRFSGRRRRLSQLTPTVDAMPPLPRITGRELARALGKRGWVVVAQKGSHAQLKHPARGGRVTVPLHAGETIGPGLLRSILSQAGMTAEELRAVL
jgi:predicted RNA binding protein YcfA (HicA-like mRNA interferase family)